jgi:DNA modification methylase
MGFKDIQSSNDIEYLSEPIERDEYKIYFHDCSYMPEIPDNSIELIWTSPPYFSMRGTVEYDSYVDYLAEMYNIFCEMYDKLKPGRPIVVNISDYQVSQEVDKGSSKIDDAWLGDKYDIPSHFSYLLYKLDKNHASYHSLNYEDRITWVKPGSTSHRAGTFIDSGLPLKYKPNQVTEELLVFRKGDMDYKKIWKQKRRSNLYSDLDLSTYDKFEEAFSINYEKYREYLNDYWEVNPETQSDHPAPFSEELAKTVIALYTLPRETVLDPFLGSGTTTVAAQVLNRKSVGYENMDAESDDTPDFVDLIKNRTGANNSTLDAFQ